MPFLAKQAVAEVNSASHTNSVSSGAAGALSGSGGLLPLANPSGEGTGFGKAMRAAEDLGDQGGCAQLQSRLCVCSGCLGFTSPGLQKKNARGSCSDGVPGWGMEDPGFVLQWVRTWLCSLGGQNLPVLQHEHRAGSAPEASRALDQPEKFVVCEARSCLFIST